MPPLASVPVLSKISYDPLPAVSFLSTDQSTSHILPLHFEIVNNVFVFYLFQTIQTILSLYYFFHAFHIFTYIGTYSSPYLDTILIIIQSLFLFLRFYYINDVISKSLYDHERRFLKLP